MKISRGNRLPRSPLTLAGIAALALLLLVSPVTAGAQQAEEGFALPEIVVLGSRRQHSHSSTTNIAPTDVIEGEALTNQGSGDVSNLVRTLVPSYNVSAQPLSDAATFIRPANLRGLASDQSLVFVNGKRRHRGAVISFLGNGVSDASQGPDISVIPAIAIKRIEVLRDSASAQYGSDAIAGVINFVLKDSPEDGTVETQWGQTYEGDGAEYRFAGNVGVPVTEDGFLNVSAEYRDTEPTVRSVQRDDAQALIDGGNTFVRQPYAQTWGAADIDGDTKVFINFGLDPTEKSTIYAFANYARREAEYGFFFRNPETRSGVNVRKDGGKIVGDLEYTLPANFKTGASCAGKNLKAGDTFRWDKCFPGGFTPQFGGTITDMGGSVGFRGSLDSGLTYDVSYTGGRSKADFRIRESINSSLGPESPTQFELGSYVQTEHTGNVDLAYPIRNSLFSSPIFAAAGVEVRREEFEVRPGEEDSYRAGDLARFGFGTGANGFSGFSPEISGEWGRNNMAFYVDLETDIASGFTLGTMGRVEKFENFGSTTDGKLAAIYWVAPWLGLRASASTGFRVPTAGQENIQNVTTAFIEGALAQQGTVPPTCPEARKVGAEALSPEESLTFSTGVVAEAGPFSLTVDYFNIKVDDRIGRSKDYNLDRSEVDNPCLEANDVLRFTFFGNGFDTRTQGVDVVWTLDLNDLLSFERGRTDLVFAGNFTSTEVTKYDPDFLDEKRILQLEKALPRYRFNMTLGHAYNSWKGLVRVNFYGPYTETHTDNLNRLIEAESEFTFDVEASYMVKNRLELSVGAENVFNNFPARNPFEGEAGSKYPESSPMGVNGGFFYGRVRYYI